MTFRELAQYFDKLEKTSSRLTLIDILTELFARLTQGEVGKVSYLLQGRVAPFYQPLEIGMSEKLVASAVARAYGFTKDDVLGLYGKLGDMGNVALRLATLAQAVRGSEEPSGSRRGKLHKTTGPNVIGVFDTLTEIARTSGAGTVEKKVSTLADLLKQVDPISAKHLVRIPLGVSRLGIGDPTVLDAFAKLKLGDRSKRKLLEKAYNQVSDLGLVGESLWKGGLKAIGKLDVSVGRPIRSELAERLPTPEKVIEKMSFDYAQDKTGVNAQRKLDGFRVQIHKDGGNVRLFSRNLEETTPMFPEIAGAARQQIKAKTAILDAEAIGYNPTSGEFLPFQETTQRHRKYDIEQTAKKIPLRAFVFDVLYLDGKSLIDQPLTRRLEYLKRVLGAGEVLFAEYGEVVDTPQRLQQLFDQSISEGLEGLVVKRLDSKYEAGARNFNWVKLKRHSSGELQDTIDCVILGYIFGKGKRTAFGAGALLVGVYDDKKDEFVTVSKIGTGLTDEEWRSIEVKSQKLKVKSKQARVNSKITPSVWLEPKIVIEVLADEITKSPLHTAGYALRFPRLVTFRGADKKAEDATTLKELVEMYRQQFQK